MNINIAANLKRLRKQRELTQEDLANFIGVSFQAVSKWECGDGYPDITFLPVLSSFFEITVDELLGIDKIRDDEEVKKILELNYSMAPDGKSEERIALLRDAVKRYPGNYELLMALATVLTFIQGADEETKEQNRKESMEICERILARCTNNVIRNNAQVKLCYLYDEMGQKEKAAEIAGELPYIWNCGLIYADFLTGDKRIKAIRHNILHLTDALDWQVERISSDDTIPIEDEIEIYKRMIQIFRLVFDEGEFYHLAVNMGERYRYLACCYMVIGDNESALDALEQALPYAIAYDNQPEEAEYKSVMLRGLKFERAGYGKDYTESWCYWLLKVLDEAKFDPIRNDPRFIAVAKKLRSHAKQ